MPRITYIAADGAVTILQHPGGTSLMRIAVENNVKGIEGQCGGSLACATCHVYVDAAWVDRLPAATGDEIAMLDFTACERREASRLSCQIELIAALDGIVVRMPENQF